MAASPHFKELLRVFNEKKIDHPTLLGPSVPSSTSFASFTSSTSSASYSCLNATIGSTRIALRAGT